ncbi:MAG: phosphatase [Bacteroidia bacterium]|jgi:exopolyphosphatase/guanosine-5'-triphosphate,3'-diphosphate pyrophosphatase|nr:phosphatase [Bacteroidia bacterium]
MKAILDLGTNTFHLLIASLDGHAIVIQERLQIPVKIGQGGLADGFIQPEAFERGIQALTQFRKVLDAYGFGVVTAYGTSAIRDAQNGSNFVEEAFNRCRIRIEAITGEQEADLIYLGVSKSFDLPTEPVCVMDIGGGSVEFCIGVGAQVLWKKSYPVGAARLIHQFPLLQQFPIPSHAEHALMEYLLGILSDLKEALSRYPSTILVGSAGSFETLVDVLRLDLNEQLLPLSEAATEVSLEAFNRFHQTIISLPMQGRAALKGMVDFRVEMIGVASILMQTVVKAFQFKRIIASQYALKEGMLFA